MMDSSGKTVPVILVTDQVSVFLPILAKGFLMPQGKGNTIHDFLVKELGIEDYYIENRIQTIFLNGKAVDNIETTGISNGDTLSLSAAMPGLVGATFRRGGRYAAMRQSVSHSENETSTPAKTKIIILKLFNLIAKEIGPGLLERGIRIPGDDLIPFLLNQSKDFWQKCKVVVNGRNAVKKLLLDSGLESNTIFLRITPPS
jgi:hypothetical protein